MKSSQLDPPAQPDALGEVDRLLHLIYHRNKNQHRGQKWWKWVGMLRRSVGKLLFFAGSQWRRREEERKKEYLEERVREVVLPGAWTAFSTLVADSQFSTLGVVLIALLARVGRIVGLPIPQRQSLDMMRDPKSSLACSVRETGLSTGEIVLKEYVEDLGDVLDRQIDSETLRPTGALKEPIAQEEAVQPDTIDLRTKDQKVTVLKDRAKHQDSERIKSRGRPKKRRKTGNVIDDLFGDLVD